MGKGLVGFVIVTAAEVTGLSVWLWLSQQGAPWLGYAALVVGEGIEWALLAFLIATSPTSYPLKQGRTTQAHVVTGLTSLFETVLWVAWAYSIHVVGFVVATLALFAIMHVKHGVDVAVYTGRSIRDDIFDRIGLVATVSEVGGAALWYQLTAAGYATLGIAILAIAISIEHALQFKAAGLFSEEPVGALSGR